MSIAERLVELWIPLLFVGLFIYYPVNLVIGVYSGEESSRKQAAMLTELLVGLECLAVKFALGIWIFVVGMEGLILPADRYLTLNRK
jgi:hypothetical protein